MRQDKLPPPVPSSSVTSAQLRRVDAIVSRSISIAVFGHGGTTRTVNSAALGSSSAFPVHNTALFAQLHQLPGPPTVKSVAAGAVHSLALDSNGVVWAWGNNSFGQLGLGNYIPPVGSPVVFASPITAFPPGTVITAIAAGAYHSLALDNAGNVWAWGQNHSEGSSESQLRRDPQRTGKVGPLPAEHKDHRHRRGRGSHSLAVDSGGNVFAWSKRGRAARQRAKHQPIWADAHHVSGRHPRILTVAAGGGHSLALDANHNVWAWGTNGEGQLGNQTFGYPSNVPVRVLFPEGTFVDAIAAGTFHSLALESEAFIFDLEAVLEFSRLRRRCGLYRKAFDPDEPINVETHQRISTLRETSSSLRRS